MSIKIITMDIYKIGGASIKDAAAIRNIGKIILKAPQKPRLIVASAMGKNTNALEEIVEQLMNRNKGKAKKLLASVIEAHKKVFQELECSKTRAENEFFQLAKQLNDIVTNTDETITIYDYTYAQIVAYGELFSTLIVYSFLQKLGLEMIFADARKYIETCPEFRNATVNMSQTRGKIKMLQNKADAISKSNIIITQGFIASSSNGTTTTLGREGSDYSAAIFADAMDADRLIIWKDVPGFLNADPNLMDDTVLLEKLPYPEAIELVYYGAKILHPKTIRPVHDKKIPLYLKSFLEPQKKGTLISHFEEEVKLPPCYTARFRQVLFSINTNDLSFISEQDIHKIYNQLSKTGIRVHMMQNSATSLSLCFDYDEIKVEKLMRALKKNFRIRYNHPVRLLNIRYFDAESERKAKEGKEILLEQKSRRTLQLVVRSVEDAPVREQISWV